MYIETDLTRIDSKEEIDITIDKLTDVISKLKKHRSALQSADTLRPKYKGGYFIQNRYEYGVRFMHVLDCALKDGYLAFLAYGAEWDEQEKALQFIDSSFPVWFEDVLYGELEETDLEGLKKGIRECIDCELNEDLIWRKKCGQQLIKMVINGSLRRSQSVQVKNGIVMEMQSL